ncbi:hypothetical protein, partial [Enterobacter hormaechei]
YCLKTQPATGETYPKSDLFNKATIGCKTFIEKMLMFQGHAEHGRFSAGRYFATGEIAFGQCTGVKNVNFSKPLLSG